MPGGLENPSYRGANPFNLCICIAFQVDMGVHMGVETVVTSRDSIVIRTNYGVELYGISFG